MNFGQQLCLTMPLSYLHSFTKSRGFASGILIGVINLTYRYSGLRQNLIIVRLRPAIFAVVVDIAGSVELAGFVACADEEAFFGLTAFGVFEFDVGWAW